MPKESRSRMQKWPSSTSCPPNSTVTGTTHFYPVAIRSAHVICAQALSNSTIVPVAFHATSLVGSGRLLTDDDERWSRWIILPPFLYVVENSGSRPDMPTVVFLGLPHLFANYNPSGAQQLLLPRFARRNGYSRRALHSYPQKRTIGR